MRIKRKILQALPKTDLHTHLDGALRYGTVAGFYREEGLEVPEDIEGQLTVPEKCRDLVDYLSAFDLPLRFLQKPGRLKRVAFEMAEDFAKENVWYLEVRFAPYLHTQEGMDADEVIQSVLAGLKEAENKFDIQTGLILTAMRQDDPEYSKKLAGKAAEYRDRGVVALDLAGAEAGYPAKKHLEAFYRARNENINLTIHAGEAFGPESIHQAIHYCGAHRIGHGVRLIEDPELMRYVNDHRIPLEVCLTSNVQTDAVDTFEDHPFKTYLARGLRVTLNTDSRTVSNTTVTDEYLRAVEHYNLSLTDIRQLIINGFKSAFMSYEDKSTMLKKAIAETEKILYEQELKVEKGI